jgi:general nucleoside transport system permease protein
MRQVLRNFVSPIVASAIALVIGGIVVTLNGYDPFLVYGALVSGAFGNAVNFGNTLAGATPLILAGLGIAVGFRAGLFNIGAEGQYWIGATAATFIGYKFAGLPGWLHTFLCLLTGMVAGGIWGGVIPGLTKAFRGAHEVITTMMMSYIGILLGKYLVEEGPMRQPGYIPQSPEISSDAWLNILIPQSLLTTGIYIALVAVVVVWFLLFRTTFGFQLRAVGLNHRAARYAGIGVTMFTVLSLGFSGMLAGLAGSVQMLGIDHRLLDSFSTGYGYTAIVVALLARSNPFGVVLSGIFFAALGTGGQYMQQVSQVPASLTDVLTGLIVFFVAAERIIPMLRDWAKRRQTKARSTRISREGHEPV